MKFQCPCCGYYTLPESRLYDICPVCNWEDDYSQFHNPDFEGGANDESLNQARKNYQEYGVSDKKFIDKIRKPLYDELPEKNTI